jgi:hypothetical protein
LYNKAEATVAVHCDKSNIFKDHYMNQNQNLTPISFNLAKQSATSVQQALLPSYRRTIFSAAGFN